MKTVTGNYYNFTILALQFLLTLPFQHRPSPHYYLQNAAPELGLIPSLASAR
jgi:hypothetical protein